MPQRLTNLKIDRVAAVDRGAGEGVRVLLMKRATSMETEPSDAEVDAYLKRDIFAEHEKKAQVEKRAFSTKEREELASSGKAMPGGGYPIENEGDLKNAIRAYGRGKNKPAVKEHIMRRARALGRSDIIPDKWKGKKTEKVAPFTRLLEWVGIKKDAVEFDDAQANAEAAEYAQGLMDELCEAHNSLQQSVCSIMNDPDVADKQAALEETFAQFKAHIAGVVPEGIENAMAAAGLVAAGYGLTEGGALTKGADMEMIAKAELDKKAEEAKKEKERADKEKERGDKAEKRYQAILKISDAHREYMNHEDVGMSEKEKDDFADMTPAERDEHIKKNPIAEAKKKRLNGLPESVRKDIEAGQAALARVTKIEDERLTETFTKRASEIGLGADKVPHMIALHKAVPAAYDALETVIKALTAQIKEAGLFKEFGNRGNDTGAKAQMAQKVAELRKADPKIKSDSVAVAKIAADPANKDLWEAYKAETQKAA